MEYKLISVSCFQPYIGSGRLRRLMEHLERHRRRDNLQDSDKSSEIEQRNLQASRWIQGDENDFELEVEDIGFQKTERLRGLTTTEGFEEQEGMGNNDEWLITAGGHRRDSLQSQRGLSPQSFDGEAEITEENILSS